MVSGLPFELRAAHISVKTCLHFRGIPCSSTLGILAVLVAAVLLAFGGAALLHLHGISLIVFVVVILLLGIAAATVILILHLRARKRRRWRGIPRSAPPPRILTCC